MLFALVVVLLAWLAVQLGQWQFHRLDERQQSNRIVATNLDRPPAPVDEVLSTRRAPSDQDEWRRVTVHGTWDDQHTIVLKYQTRDQGAGVDVVTPLVTDDGAAVLVDRGWMPTENSGASRPELPEVTPGQVTVTGWVRRDATGSATKVSDDLSTRAVSSSTSPTCCRTRSTAVSSTWPRRARSRDRLEPTELPDDAQQRSALLLRVAVVVLRSAGDLRVLLPRMGRARQRRGQRRGTSASSRSDRSMPPSMGSITPVTKDDAGLSRKAAAAANSSGRP